MNQSAMAKTGIGHSGTSPALMLVAVIMLLTGSSFALGRSAGAAVAGGTIAGESAGTNGTTSCPKGAAPGVSSHQIVIAATVIDLSEGSLTNSTFGVPPVATQDADWNTVANSINKSGGVGCRQIVMHYYDINPADPDGQNRHV